MGFAVSGVCRKKEGKSLRHEKNCVLHGYGVVVVGLFFLSVGRLADTAFNGDASSFRTFVWLRTQQHSARAYLPVACHQRIQCSPQQWLLDLPINIGEVQSVVGLGYDRGHSCAVRVICYGIYFIARRLPFGALRDPGDDTSCRVRVVFASLACVFLFFVRCALAAGG